MRPFNYVGSDILVKTQEPMSFGILYCSARGKLEVFRSGRFKQWAGDLYFTLCYLCAMNFFHIGKGTIHNVGWNKTKLQREKTTTRGSM